MNVTPSLVTIPGFIDLQVNGYLGYGFGSETPNHDQCITACRALLNSGTAAFLPTITTSSIPKYRKSLPFMAKIARLDEFHGKILGLHIEGPFISPEPGAVGVHRPAYVLAPDIPLLEQLQDWSDGLIKLLTIAPEIPGAEALTRAAVKMGITVSIGHSMASATDIDKVVSAGASAFTHLGNGLPNLIHRHHNPIWPALANDAINAMFVTDGHHLPAPMVKAMIHAKGVSRSIVVSDAASLAGLHPGKYTKGNNTFVLEENGLLHDPVKQCLAGSASTMFQCMNHLASLQFLTLDDLIKVGFTNPLKLIGVDPASIPPGPKITFTGSGFAIEKPS